MGKRATSDVKPACCERWWRLLWPFAVLTLLLSLLPAPALGFELGSLILAFSGGGSHAPQCPSQCTCTVRRAEDVMQDYVTAHLPRMGSHMDPQLETQLRSSVTLTMSWLGNMADLQCHVSQGERVNLTDLLQASSLSFTSVRVSCQPAGGVVWDVSAYTSFVNVLQLSGCGVHRAHDSPQALAVPQNLWVLDLEGAPPDTVESLDLSAASQLQMLSITHSNLSSLPQHWSTSRLPRLAFVSLAHNQLSGYDCELKSPHLTALNLDNNQLTALPPCVMDGTKYTTHLSVRHNNVRSLEELLASKAEGSTPPAPQLSYLDVAHNQVSSLRGLRKMELLAGLDVSYNGIGSVTPDTFSSHPALVWLDLSNNMLQIVPDGFLSKQVSMHHLNLSHNHLWSFGSDQSPPSSKPVTVDLRHNQLIYPPYADSGYVPPSSTHISAAHNPYRCDCYIHLFIQTTSDMDKSRKNTWFSMGYWDSSAQGAATGQPYVDTDDMICHQPADIKGAPITSLSFHKTCPLLRGCPKDCKCVLIKGDTRHVSVDCSHSEALTDLPNVVPVVADATLVLYVNQSGLKRLEHRAYLPYVSELHAAYSKLSSVTSAAIQALQNVSVLSLHHTQLRSLPAVLQNLTMPAVTNVSLSGNPWTCGCRDLWMPEWLAKHGAALFDLHSIRCRWTGKLVTDLTPEDLSCGIFNYLPLVIAVSMITGLAAIASSLLLKYKQEVLVFIYMHFRLRPFDMYKHDTTKPFLFDVFVSFSQHNYSWVVEKLVDQLENRARPYKLCIHLRDFPVGATLADSVTWAVDNSRCTLLVLTRDLLASEWSLSDFRAAHARLFQEPGAKAKLLVVVHGPLDARSLDRDLLQYLRQHVYLKTEDKLFWSKLEYALPDPQEMMMMMTPGAAGSPEMGGAPSVEMDCLLPVGMASGDVYPKQNSTSTSASEGPCS